MKPLTGIVVLNYHNAPGTIECISSLQLLDYPSFFVVVVDNNSTDGSAEAIKAYIAESLQDPGWDKPVYKNKSFPKISFLASDTNGGYARGNNIGIQACLANGCDYVLVLNSDII